MRRVIYSVAMSLDGFIAGPDGEYDWIPQDPSIDFGAFYRRFDSVLMGRRTFEIASKGPGGLPSGMNVYVFSKTLGPGDPPNRTIVADDAASFVGRLRDQPGKEIWLMGGGELFRSLLEAGQVDGIEVAVVPILLGGGIPLLPPSRPIPLEWLATERYPRSGIVSLTYRFKSDASPR